MPQRLQARGDVAVGAPDEISALCYCIGASQRGVKALTATSGPGWALMIEAFQYALMTETPLVVALVQRLGPSTGGAPVPVFAPSTPGECFALTVQAFNWAEALRTPVVLLSDKDVAMTYEAVDLGALPDVPVWTRQSPPFAPVGGPRKVTLTGSAHNKDGWLRKNDPETLDVLRQLEAKVAARAAELALPTGGP